MMKKNKILSYLIIFLLLCAMVVLIIPVAGATVTESSEGLPYHDFSKYTYFTRDYRKTVEGTDSKLDFNIEVTVRDKQSQKIMSQDKLNVVIDGIPVNEVMVDDGTFKMSALSKTMIWTYKKNDVTSEKDVEQIWLDYKKSYSEYTNTTFKGRPAIVKFSESGVEYSVYMNDLRLPDTVLIVNFWVLVDINYGFMRDTLAAREFEEQYGAMMQPKRDELIKAVSNINITVNKKCLLRNRSDGSAAVSETITTDASATAGTSSAGVIAVIVLGGAAAAALGAGAAGAAADKSGSTGGSSFKMVLYKDFGDKIKYNGDTVYVYAKMVEITSDGLEKDRLDLTQQINISSKEPGLLTVSACSLSGDYMAAGVMAGPDAGEDIDAEAEISFLFSGAGGTFRNNVIFKVVGKAYIALAGETLYVLADSGRSFELPYDVVNFTKPADEIKVLSMQKDDSFELSLGQNKHNKPVIMATDHPQRKPVERFFDTFACEIEARNDVEYARSVFSVVLCHEGVLPDFLGKEKEIIAYKNTEDEMPTTDVALRLGTWNEEKQTLELCRPGEDIGIEFTDENRISSLIGVKYEFNSEKSTDAYLLSTFSAEKSLPSPSSVKGELKLSYTINNESVESLTEVLLMPDLQTYEQDWQKEYDNCVKIITTYLPAEFRTKKLQQLNDNKDKMGIADLQLFRRNCWAMASCFIMQEKEDYLIASYWYDEAIATADLLVYVGDIALDVALAPFGGPITGFVVSQVKSALIELVSMRIEKGKIGYQEISDLVTNRLVQAAGQADGLVETPGFDKPKVLIAWLVSFILYRIMYRWYFDMDESGNPKGLSEAIQNGLLDFAGKGVSILLGEYAKDIAAKRGIDVGSTADAEQKYVNEKVSGAAKAGLDALDNVADLLDKKLSQFTGTLAEFIERIRSGGIQFT